MGSIVVTGGSRGLGLAIVRRLAEAGHTAVAVSRGMSSELEAAVRAAEGGPGRIAFHAADLEDIPGLAALAMQLAATYGPLYGLVNNAGIGTGGLLASMADDAIAQVIRLNLLSPVTLTRHVVRAMMATGGSRIVNISSITATHGHNGLSVYAATKAGLIGFTQSLARELGPLGITVNAVAPGFIATEMTAGMGAEGLAKIARRASLRRLAEPGDVAGAVAYFVSEDARNVTGTVLGVDAGG